MNTFISEIYSQPDVIIETAKAVQMQLTLLKPLLERLQRGEFRRLVFTGMGSSLSAVYPSLLRLTNSNIIPQVIEAAELLHYQHKILSPQTLLIVISQSGGSAELPGLLELAAQQQTPIVGITNTPNSLLQRRSRWTLLMKAGKEATVSTKTYTCTLALLHLLTSAFLEESLEDTVASLVLRAESIRERLTGWHDQMKLLADQWADTPFLEYLGRGSSLASASTAALISKESIKIPTEGMNAGQFRHGPLELVDERFTGILFGGANAAHDLNIALARDIVNFGGRLLFVSQVAPSLPGTAWVEMPSCPPSLLPLVEIIPIQLLCAEMSVRRGYEAGQFRYIGKVTVQE